MLSHDTENCISIRQNRCLFIMIGSDPDTETLKVFQNKFNKAVLGRIIAGHLLDGWEPYSGILSISQFYPSARVRRGEWDKAQFVDLFSCCSNVNTPRFSCFNIVYLIPKMTIRTPM